MRRFVRVMIGLGLAAMAVPGFAQQPLPRPVPLPVPKIILPLPPPKSETPADKPAPPKAGPLELPYRTTTPAIEVMGSPDFPAPLAEFSPVRLTTGPIEVVGTATFRPIRLTTPPIEVVGAEE